MNLYKLMLASSIVSAAVLTLFFSYTRQNNTCVQSSYVEKAIFHNVEILNCSKNTRVDWDANLEKEIKDLNSRLLNIESFIKTKNRPTIKIEILDQKNTFYYSHQHLFISKNILSSTQSLELFLIKNWIYNLNPLVSENKILEDLVVNFKYYLIYGNLANSVAPRNFQPQIIWKQNQRASNYECISSWHLTRDWNLCVNHSYQFFETSFGFIYERLYSKVLGSWIDALNSLTMAQKFDINNNFKLQVANYDLPNTGRSLKENSFTYNLKVLSQFWLLNKDLPTSDVGKKFLFTFLKGLNKYNFHSLVESTKFDLIYFKQNLNWNTVYENKNIYLLLKKNPNLKIAVSNFKEMMILPIDKKIKMDVFSYIKADQVVLETCTTMKISEVMKYARLTEKLILTYDCDLNQFKKVDQLLAQGATGFASQNMDVPFAQFHLPSLVQKKEWLDPEAEVFQYVQARNVKNSVYEVFGWQELNWDQVTKAYKPKAYVDGVGYFRTRFSYQ